jgi:hypothetical protein
MSVSKEENESDQKVRPIRVTRRDGGAAAYEGWIEENPNGSITVHYAQGSKTIFLKDQYQEWHFEDTEA